MKKISFTFGAIATIATPLSVISCNESTTDNSSYLERIGSLTKDVETLRGKINSKTTKLGDQVKISFEGRSGGKDFDDSTPFSGGTAPSYDLILGSGTFISSGTDPITKIKYDGFEDQLVGMNVGDTKIITILFPTPYQEKSLEGKPAFFKVHIFSARRIINITK